MLEDMIGRGTGFLRRVASGAKACVPRPIISSSARFHRMGAAVRQRHVGEHLFSLRFDLCGVL